MFIKFNKKFNTMHLYQYNNLFYFFNTKRLFTSVMFYKYVIYKTRLYLYFDAILVKAGLSLGNRNFKL